MSGEALQRETPRKFGPFGSSTLEMSCFGGSTQDSHLDHLDFRLSVWSYPHCIVAETNSGRCLTLRLILQPTASMSLDEVFHTVLSGTARELGTSIAQAL